MIVYLNGRMVESESASVGIADRGILYGDGLYETIRVRSSRPVRYERHMERLHSGAVALEMPESVLATDYASAITELLKANGLTDARVRITITRGQSNDPTIIITANPLPEHNSTPISAIVSSFRRDEKNPLCAVKTINCLPSVLALSETARCGADDAIFLNTLGNIAEATTATVFVVLGNKLLTPSLDQGCLPGTLRAAVLEMAGSLGMEAVECAVTRQMLQDTDEIFFTSAIRLVRSVCLIGDKKVGSTATAERIMQMLLDEESR